MVIANGHAAPMNEVYLQALQLAKAHDQSIVGVEFLLDRRTRQPYLLTFARHSIKLWLWVPSHAASGNHELLEIRTIANWLCGMQSYDMKMLGSGRNQNVLISVVGVDSTLHWLVFRFPPREGEEPETTHVNRGLMEIWNGALTSTGEAIVTASFSGSLQSSDRGGELIHSAPFERVKQLSALIHGEDLLVAGSTQGLISIVDPQSLAVRFTLEGHMMRIRCLALTQHDTHLLSGSDDKTIRLYALNEGKGSFIRSFCGHSGAVMSVRVDDSSAGERFASVSVDGKLILWSMQNGEKLHVFESTEVDALYCVAFSPDGSYVAAGSDRATIAVFKIPQPENYVYEERWSDLDEDDGDGDHEEEEVNFAEEEQLQQNALEEGVEQNIGEESDDGGDAENPLMYEEADGRVEEKWQENAPITDEQPLPAILYMPTTPMPSGVEELPEADGNPEQEIHEEGSEIYGLDNYTRPLGTADDAAVGRGESDAQEEEDGSKQRALLED